MQHVAGYPEPELPVTGLGRLGELHLVVVQGVAEFVLFLSSFLDQLPLQLADLPKHHAESFVHGVWTRLWGCGSFVPALGMIGV